LFFHQKKTARKAKGNHRTAFLQIARYQFLPNDYYVGLFRLSGCIIRKNKSTVSVNNTDSGTAKTLQADM